MPDPPTATKRRPIALGRRGPELVGVITAAASILVAVIASAGGLFGTLFENPPKRKPVDVTQRELLTVRRDIRTLQARLQLLAQPSNRGRLASEVRALKGRLADVEKTSSDLRAAILPDPTEAVQVPLLRKDVEQLQSSSDDSLKGVARDIDRQFAFITFIAGSLGIGLLSQVLATRRRAREEPAPTGNVPGSR